MSDQGLTRASFRGLNPLVEPIAIPPPGRRWSGEEWARIRRGHRSSEMEDKWDAFVEGDRLFFHRSWTGHGIYEADFTRDGDSWVVSAARVVGDHRIYLRGSGAYEALMLEALIGGVLLGGMPEDYQVRLNSLPKYPIPRIEAVRGDITHQKVDAIVNAANGALRGGGGVDGAIHRAAGPRLAEAGAALAPCETGDAKATPAFNLDPPVRYVFHTVGPVWRGGERDEATLLRSCYWRCLDLADQLGVKSMAFPAISTGVYGYPPELAADVAVKALHIRTDVELIRLVAFDDKTYQLYCERLREPA